MDGLKLPRGGGADCCNLIERVEPVEPVAHVAPVKPVEPVEGLLIRS